jgi:2-oxoisovalerate dehydrogenase E1 component
VAFDMLLNQAAKLRYMTGGAVEIPMVVRTQTGTGRASGAQHSQSLEALVAHIPGLRVVMPATVDDAAGLLRGAIRDPRPVVYIENRRLYGRKATRPESLPEPIPLGRATVRRSGDALTMLSWGRMVHVCLEAAGELEKDGLSVEVIDLRSLVPADMDTVVESVIKTSRLLVVQEAVRDFGAGAEFASRVCEAAFDYLDAPPARLGGKFTPVPYSPALESHWVPSKGSVVEAARRLVGH